MLSMILRRGAKSHEEYFYSFLLLEIRETFLEPAGKLYDM